MRNVTTNEIGTRLQKSLSSTLQTWPHLCRPVTLRLHVVGWRCTKKSSYLCLELLINLSFLLLLQVMLAAIIKKKRLHFNRYYIVVSTDLGHLKLLIPGAPGY